MGFKNIIRVDTKIEGYQIMLSIEIKDYADNDFVRCFEAAKDGPGSYTLLFGSGAPTVGDASLLGNYITTRAFPNNEYTKIDVKKFLSELDSLLDVAYRLYDNLMKEKEKQKIMEQKKKEQEALDKKRLDDYFNN